MKTCGKCCVEKMLTEFYPKRRKLARDGHASICKACAKIGASEWAKSNRVAHLANTKKWFKENKAKHAICVANWSACNVGKRNQGFASRRASKKSATPKWGNKFFMEESYDLARLRTNYTGYEWEVDHIVPLQSSIVCGLHVEHNLQVIPGIQNRRKHNLTWPDMP